MAPERSDRGIRSWLVSLRGFSAPVFFSKRKIATGAAALLAAGVAYHVVFGANGLTVYEQKRQETQALSAQLQQLQHENDLLKGHVDRLENDPDAIEQQARQELHYTRPGEVIYALPSEPPTDSGTTATQSDPQAKQ